jgi:glycosyltransferase involved in cell wall biosynthesis
MASLDLVMIARNESRCIARALHSVRPWVDAMWVLDTGSQDDTVAIAQAHGAQVAHFTWCDDFSAARNAALALSQADWVLVLDADEWLAGPGLALKGLRERAPGFLAQVQVVSQFENDAGLLQEAPSWITRVLPRGVRYAGRVHEQPQSDLPRQRLELRLLHDGYREAQCANKVGRNQRLLQRALNEAPQDAYLHYQCGKDFEICGRYAEALPHYELAMAACPPQAGWRHDLVLRLLFTLKLVQRFEPAMSLAAQEMERWPNSPDFYFTLGDVLLGWASHEAERGGELLPLIEQAWVKALEIGEQPNLQDTVRGRGSFLAAHNLAVLHESLGNEPSARAWREREAAMRA